MKIALMGAIALLAGAMFPLQAALNARVAKVLHSPVWAAAISGAVLTVILVAVALMFVRPTPSIAAFRSIPAFSWAAGLCGVVVLVTTTALAPRMGAASMVAFVIAGQIIGALIIDHYGMFGLEVKPMDIQRLAAALLVGAAGFLLR